MAIFFSSISSVISILLMITAGYFCQAKGWLSKHFSNSISNLLMNMALPISIFVSMVNDLNPKALSKLSVGLFYSILSTFVTLIIAWLIVKLAKVKKGRRGIAIMVITAPNTLFIGVPINLSLFGETSIPYVLVYYVVHIFLIWTIGVYLIAIDDPTNTNTKVKFDWHNLLPAPVWGLIVAIPFVFIPALGNLLKSWTCITVTLKDISNLVTPLALIYIGIMLKKFGIKHMTIDKDVLISYLGRFILVPLVTVLLLLWGNKYFYNIGKVFTQTLILQAALPALAVVPILADRYHCDVKFATNLVVSTSILFIIVVPIVMLLINI
ncbi:AEC family transporter [Lactobacillus sp. ESL0791]|uniref:AEC family transporter n=1 Tax=Lactobacillus sp. ESL0791 TaxID=2983234 RepID=UPI0023F6750C|nr:AEC family transporter [Lactobacillus sp. ESL0791]MDF7637926.1 AEC family transporter [Lactobacillus sp. ESL0791]